MNPKSQAHNKTSYHKEALGLSLMPAFFAAGCCATGPLMFIFGVSVAELALYEYRWTFRLAGCMVMFISLAWYFRVRGVVSIQHYRDNMLMVSAISLHTLLFSLVLYYIFVHILTPMVWQHMEQELVNCCGL